ncbi:Conserved oligomeric Golgi complex subunit 1 (COG1) [Paratrimastix pyriformis]|uniref:Conserved oligomeric Golgi complex subunit 1 (COG1) n=1 Tax=Paratrimastix pyriformis TaxID=342808 RepID=A0ABQ8V0K5_9EUKA|nr:Conserved oligomeric Golgi complex subunit 1 (COG1) [Paratrimastix pyriformis]
MQNPVALVERLFTERPVNEAKQYVDDVRRGIAARDVELRSIVGDRYHDIIGCTDTLVEMGTRASHLERTSRHHHTATTGSSQIEDMEMSLAALIESLRPITPPDSIAPADARLLAELRYLLAAPAQAPGCPLTESVLRAALLAASTVVLRSAHLRRLQADPQPASPPAGGLCPGPGGGLAALPEADLLRARAWLARWDQLRPSGPASAAPPAADQPPLGELARLVGLAGCLYGQSVQPRAPAASVAAALRHLMDIHAPLTAGRPAPVAPPPAGPGAGDPLAGAWADHLSALGQGALDADLTAHHLAAGALLLLATRAAPQAQAQAHTQSAPQGRRGQQQAREDAIVDATQALLEVRLAHLRRSIVAAAAPKQQQQQQQQQGWEHPLSLGAGLVGATIRDLHGIFWARPAASAEASAAGRPAGQPGGECKGEGEADRPHGPEAPCRAEAALGRLVAALDRDLLPALRLAPDQALFVPAPTPGPLLARPPSAAALPAADGTATGLGGGVDMLGAAAGLGGGVDMLGAAGRWVSRHVRVRVRRLAKRWLGAVLAALAAPSPGDPAAAPVAPAILWGLDRCAALARLAQGAKERIARVHLSAGTPVQWVRACLAVAGRPVDLWGEAVLPVLRQGALAALAAQTRAFVQGALPALVAAAAVPAPAPAPASAPPADGAAAPGTDQPLLAARLLGPRGRVALGAPSGRLPAPGRADGWPLVVPPHAEAALRVAGAVRSWVTDAASLAAADPRLRRALEEALVQSRADLLRAIRLETAARAAAAPQCGLALAGLLTRCAQATMAATDPATGAPDGALAAGVRALVEAWCAHAFAESLGALEEALRELTRSRHWARLRLVSGTEPLAHGGPPPAPDGVSAPAEGVPLGPAQPLPTQPSPHVARLLTAAGRTLLAGGAAESRPAGAIGRAHGVACVATRHLACRCAALWRAHVVEPIDRPQPQAPEGAPGVSAGGLAQLVLDLTVLRIALGGPHTPADGGDEFGAMAAQLAARMDRVDAVLAMPLIEAAARSWVQATLFLGPPPAPLPVPFLTGLAQSQQQAPSPAPGPAAPSPSLSPTRGVSSSPIG